MSKVTSHRFRSSRSGLVLLRARSAGPNLHLLRSGARLPLRLLRLRSL